MAQNVFAKGSQRKSVSNPSSTVTPAFGITGEVSSALQSLPIIQQSLQDIQHRLNGLDEVRLELQGVKEGLREDLWGDDGLAPKIEYVAQQAEETGQNLETIMKENKSLRQELELLKSVVIRMDRKVSEQEKEITELKGRSMRDNLLIHRFAEKANENLMVEVPIEIKKVYGIDVRFVRIHRMGPMRNGKIPRIIVGKLEKYEMKEDVLQSQRQLRQQQQETPFHVSPQYPSSLVENRKHLSELQKKYTDQKVETKIKGNKLVFKNGNVYKDKVLVPRAEDVLLALDEEKEALGHIEVVTSEEKREKGNRFIANAAEAKTYGDVRKVYKKICSIPIHAQASHRILVYRFTDKDGKLIDGYMDDGEYGAGRNLLKHLEERRLNNVVCVVTRWYGGEHLGGMRFELMKDVATEAAQKLNP